jgi:hypothetical protein
MAFWGNIYRQCRKKRYWMHLSDEHINGVHLSYFRQVVHVYYQLFDSKMADGDQLWSVPKLEYDLQRRNASTNKCFDLGMQVTLIFYLFYLEGHITRKFTLKNKKKSMDKKLDTPSTTGTRRSMNKM